MNLNIKPQFQPGRFAHSFRSPHRFESQVYRGFINPVNRQHDIMHLLHDLVGNRETPLLHSFSWI